MNDQKILRTTALTPKRCCAFIEQSKVRAGAALSHDSIEQLQKKTILAQLLITSGINPFLVQKGQESPLFLLLHVMLDDICQN